MRIAINHHPLRAWLALVALGWATGCATIVPTTCEGGVCSPQYTPARQHTKEEIVILRKGEELPEHTRFIARFSSPVDSRGGCTAEVLQLFRGKAALLGFDGVAEIEEAQDGCTGRAYIIARTTP